MSRTYTDIVNRYRACLFERSFQMSLVLSSVLFLMSIAMSFFAIQYATERASNSVTDIILSNIPAIDVDGFFVWGTLSLVVFSLFLLVANPQRVPFALNSLALFYFIRSIFVSLTHIGPFPILAGNEHWGTIAAHFLFGSDLFFSAHTGAPFLFALIFWHKKELRYIFLAWSVFMATVVLLGHYHYSIDVASAYFITYSIYHLAKFLFPKSFAIFHGASA
jgi:hypothetical protein